MNEMLVASWVRNTMSAVFPIKEREGLIKNIKSLCIHKNLQIRLGDDKVEKPARKQIEVYQQQEKEAGQTYAALWQQEN